MSLRWRISSSKIPHEVVKPGQIVKVKVMDVDVKRQRIALTMRLNDAPGIAADKRISRGINPKSAAQPERPTAAVATTAKPPTAADGVVRLRSRKGQAKEVSGEIAFVTIAHRNQLEAPIRISSRTFPLFGPRLAPRESLDGRS